MSMKDKNAIMLATNAPYRFVRGRVRLIAELGVGVEIYFNNDTIEEVDGKEVEETGKILREEGIRCSVHAPFMDLSPGGLDRAVRKVTKDKLKKTVEMANILGAAGCVCHPGYDRWRFDDYLQIWIDGSVDTWTEVLAAAGDRLPVMLENIFEEEPMSFIELFGRFEGKNLFYCFDSGHFNLFSKVPLDRWLVPLKGRLREMHLHDNHGKKDDHLPIGRGTFPFRELKGFLVQHEGEIILNAEIHEESQAVEGIKNLKELVS